MKKLIQNIVLVYFAFFMLLASIAVPYWSMTCNISNVTVVSILSDSFDCDDAPSNTTKCSTFEKSSCCLFDTGLIDADATLVVSQNNQFNTIIAYLEIPRPNAQLISTNITQAKSNFIVAIPDPDIRVMQQSFLC